MPVLLAVFCTVITSTVAHWHQQAVPPLDAVGYVWLVAGAVPLIWRNRFPYLVFVLTSALTLSYQFSGNVGGPVIVYAGLALFTLARRFGLIRAGAAGLVLITANVTASALAGTFLLEPSVIAMTAVSISVGIAARNVSASRRSQREYFEERSRRLAEEERLRIARDVHDVVAHSLAMINVQAGVGAHVADRRPEEAKQALLAIKEASHNALVDLRATLGVLRSGEVRAPAPSLSRMDELLAPTRNAGITVEVSGEPGELPAPVDSAAYRILQEALTNTVRHATGVSTVKVAFERGTTEVTVVVSDDGNAPEGQPGNGLRGMRERATALGGSLDAGQTEHGGFEVRVVLPL